VTRDFYPLRDAATGMPVRQYHGWVKKDGRDALGIYCMDCDRGVIIFPDDPVLAYMRARLSLGMFQHAILYRLWWDWANANQIGRECTHIPVPNAALVIPPVMWILGLAPSPN